MLLANKCDLKNEIAQQRQQMDRFCEEHGFAGWCLICFCLVLLSVCVLTVDCLRFETSAKEGTNVEKAADKLVDSILKNDVALAPQKADTVDISRPAAGAEAPKEKGCCS